MLALADISREQTLQTALVILAPADGVLVEFIPDKCGREP